jgi:hypothetical protein
MERDAPSKWGSVITSVDFGARTLDAARIRRLSRRRDPR